MEDHVRMVTLTALSPDALTAEADLFLSSRNWQVVTGGCSPGKQGLLWWVMLAQMSA